MDQDLIGQICDAFSLEPKKAKGYSPLALAYIGDGVFDLIIRTIFVCQANAPAQSLHEKTSRIVMASSQGRLLQAVWPDLTEEEQIFFRRGRNAKPHTIAKNASMHDYRAATGFEALVGYLYLNERMDRILYIVRLGLERTGLLTEEKEEE